MPLTLSVLDEATNGERRAAGPFEFETVAITLWELIRTRVQQDVRRFNESESDKTSCTSSSCEGFVGSPSCRIGWVLGAERWLPVEGGLALTSA